MGTTRTPPRDRPMSDMQDPTPSPPTTNPAPNPAGGPPIVPPSLHARPNPANGRSLLGCAFAVSLLLNVVAFGCFVCLCLILLLFRGGSESGSVTLVEHHYAGETSAKDKVAIVRLEGVILEGFLDYVHKQTDAAAADKDVKAVVLRINSPGGSIT